MKKVILTLIAIFISVSVIKAQNTTTGTTTVNKAPVKKEIAVSKNLVVKDTSMQKNNSTQKTSGMQGTDGTGKYVNPGNKPDTTAVKPKEIKLK